MVPKAAKENGFSTFRGGGGGGGGGGRSSAVIVPVKAWEMGRGQNARGGSPMWTLPSQSVPVFPDPPSLFFGGISFLHVLSEP